MRKKPQGLWLHEEFAEVTLKAPAIKKTSTLLHFTKMKSFYSAQDAAERVGIPRARDARQPGPTGARAPETHRHKRRATKTQTASERENPFGAIGQQGRSNATTRRPGACFCGRAGAAGPTPSVQPCAEPAPRERVSPREACP